MATTTRFTHDPNAVLDYGWDWSEWLAVGETISLATVTVPTGLTKNSQTNSATAVAAWIQGGTAGTSYAVVCHVTTSAGRQDDRTSTLFCNDR